MAFRIAVSGIRAAQANLDVTGNNIANSNTNGFKSSRVDFADVYVGAGPNLVGEGVKIAAIDQQFRQGSIEFTDNSLDLAISGEGFFLLDDDGTRMYSRAGAFKTDREGFVVNSSGQGLVGYQESNGAISGSLGPLSISTADVAPAGTTEVDLVLNVNPDAVTPANAFSIGDSTSYNSSSSLTVYDSLGGDHLATSYLVKTGVNAWNMHIRIDGDDAQTTGVVPLAFDSNGQLTSAMPVNFGNFTPTNGASVMNFDVDLTGTQQFGSSFAVHAVSQNGNTTGRLTGVNIDQDGVLFARYSNGQVQPQGQVALANFAAPTELQQVSDSTWAETFASGQPLIGQPSSSSLGAVESGALEASTVEMSEELVNMIIAQRVYQANAQVIRAEDQVTQSIINIR